MPAIPPTKPAPRAVHSMSRRQALEGWENEGGHTRPQAVPALPAGITAQTETHYLVGRYRYTDLGLACAELARQAAAAPGRVPGPEGSSQDRSDGNREYRS